MLQNNYLNVFTYVWEFPASSRNILLFLFIITDDKKKVEFHQDCLLSFFSSHWKNVATAWNLGHLNIICTEGYC